MVRDTGWFTSSFSGGANEACVEVRITDVAVGVRDSKNAAGPAFSFAPADWRAFVGKADRFRRS
jgi:hypothetical protein